MTGKSAMRGGSGYGKSRTYWHYGGGKDYRVTEKTGEDIAYQCRYTHFPNRFIGDNVQSMPNYKLVRSNYGLRDCKVENDNNGIPQIIYGDIFYAKTDGVLNQPNFQGNGIERILKPLVGGYGNVDAFYVLKYIFNHFLNKKVRFFHPSYNDGTDFYYSMRDYVELTDTNPIYLSFMMTSEKTVKEWVEEILKTIDGVMYYNNYTKQYVLKLIRNDYLIQNCIQINENHYKDLKVIKKDYQDLKNKIIIKYTHPDTFDTTTLTWVNERASNDEIKEVSYEFMMIRNHEYRKLILKRLIKKEAYPLTAFKFQLPRNLIENSSGFDFNIKIGDVLSFNNDLLNIENMAIRILEITGGKDEENYYDIVACEDIFDVSSFANLDFQANEQKETSFDLTNISDNSKVIVVDTPREMASLDNDSVLTLFADDITELTNTEIVNGYMVQDGMTGAKRSISYNCRYGEISEVVTDTKILNRAINIKINNTKNIKEISASEMDFQRMKYCGFFEDGEFFSLKNIINNNDGTYTINGILRGLANTKITQKTIGTKVFMILDGVTANNLTSLSIIPSTSKTVYINKFNNFTNTDKISKNYTYNYTLRKPYNPCSVKIEHLQNHKTKVSWGNRVRLRGRNYRSPELLIFGEDEGKKEKDISYEIFYMGNTYNTQNNEIELDGDVGTFTIKRVLNGFSSEILTYNIN